MASKLSSAELAEAMRADLGNNRLEELAIDDAARGRRGIPDRRQPPSTQPAGRPFTGISETHAASSGAARWFGAMDGGLFNDEDQKGVMGLDSIEDGNAHRRNKMPSRVPTYDPANPLGPRGNPSRTYPSAGQTSRYAGLSTPETTPGVGRGAGRGKPTPARAATHQPQTPVGRGGGALPNAHNPSTVATGSRLDSTPQGTPQGTSQKRTADQTRVSSPTAPRVPSVVVSLHDGGVGDTSGKGAVGPNSISVELLAGKNQKVENVAVEKDNQLADISFTPPHLRHVVPPVKQKDEVVSSAPQQTSQGQSDGSGMAGGIPPPLEHSRIVYRDDNTDTSLVAGKEREGVRSTVTLYAQPKIDTVFWEVATQNSILRGDIRRCVGPLMLGSLVYLRRNNGITADVQICYITFSSIIAAEKFKTALNFYRDKHANSKEELFKEKFENLEKVEEPLTDKAPSVLMSPKTEMSGQTAVEDLIVLETTRPPQSSSSQPEDLPEQREHARPSPIRLTSSSVGLYVPKRSSGHSTGSALPVIADIAKHGKGDTVQTNGKGGWYNKDSSYKILNHSVETIEKIPVGKYLSRATLLVLTNLTNKDYDSMHKEYLSMLPSTSTMSSELISMRQKRSALDVAAKWLWMKPNFTDLRFDEQKQAYAVVYANVRHGKKRVVRSVDQLIELRPSLASCPQGVIKFNEFIGTNGLNKKYNPGPYLIDWDDKCEEISEDFLADEGEMTQDQELPLAEAEQNCTGEQEKKREETKMNAPDIMSNRTIRFLLENQHPSNKFSGRASQGVPAPSTSSYRITSSPASTHRTGALPVPRIGSSSAVHHHLPWESGLNGESSTSRASHRDSHTASDHTNAGHY
ncbi:uncharacterized protein GGS22DRAFT_200026 [Annulohypoxylon maeteangense]|uniref:uncharacterized protein n=1 Tax=Annulohypoxylon maeteangense TaxID=1927788 RepID=UPI0020082B16|nr:uncharacterized protein GGS22DRAFT_200026 [Annulohypoxylon maeteangense]KAI0885872.1 hypothetical protein GGS22DRAFT_200026 [Annulohypoxylon maeteangense]